MKNQPTVTEDSSYLERVLTDEEWDDGYRRLEAMYDTRVNHKRGRDDQRRPGKAGVLLLIGLVLVMGSAGALTFIHVFVK